MGPWRSIGQSVSRRTTAVLAGVLMLTAVAVIGLGQLEFSTGQDSYIDSSSQVAKDNEQYQSLFGGENMVVLLTAPQGKTVVDVLTPATIAQLGEIEQQLASDPSIQSVVSPVTLLTWTQDLITSGVASEILARTIERELDAAAQQVRRDDAMITTLRLGAAGEQGFDNPDWVKFLVFGNDGFTLAADGTLVAPADDQLVVRTALRAFIPDARHAVFAAVLQGNLPLDGLAAGSTAVQQAFAGRTFDNATVTITGTPTFLTDINDYLQGGMLTLGSIAVLVMIVILVVAFGVRWRLLPLAGMVVGVVWGFGAFGFTGTSLSLVTIAGLPILIGLGIEFAIQVQNRIEEERDVDRAPNPFGETLVHMGPPLVIATIAAVIAFLTVKISKVPMVQDFGVLLAIGIVALLVAGVLLPTTLIGLRERRSPTTKPATAGWVEKVVDRVADRERSDQLGRPVEHGDPERPYARAGGRLRVDARCVRPDRCRRVERGVHRSDGRVRVRARAALVAGEPRARRGVEPGEHRRLVGRGAGHHVVAAHGARHAPGIPDRAAGAAGLARRVERQRHASAVPGGPVVARTTRRGARQGRGRNSGPDRVG